MPEASASRKIPLIAWFLGFGSLDLVTVFVLAYVLHLNSSPIFLYLLPPVALWGDFVDPGAASHHGFHAVLDVVFLFGGSFVLYGLLGVLLGLIGRLAISSRSPD
jgi:hypothetical protein